MTAKADRLGRAAPSREPNQLQQKEKLQGEIKYINTFQIQIHQIHFSTPPDTCSPSATQNKNTEVQDCMSTITIHSTDHVTSL